MDKSAAIQLVPRHVFPRDCFITTDNGKDWRPIHGTGCAHFVAHSLSIRGGVRGSNACIHGYPVSVRLLLDTLAPVLSVNDVQVNNIWFGDEVFECQAGKDHCGIVSSASRDFGTEATNQIPDIAITHCSNRRDGIFTDDWSKYFQRKGQFYRLVERAQLREQ
jgi:hypothetical protein